MSGDPDSALVSTGGSTVRHPASDQSTPVDPVTNRSQAQDAVISFDGPAPEQESDDEPSSYQSPKEVHFLRCI